MIAFAAAGGEIIILPLAVVAAVAAVAWYIVFRAVGADRPPPARATTTTQVDTRSTADAAREVDVNRLGDGELPGGAEGGDNSPSARRIALPSHDGTPWGDTDQHSSSARMPVGAADRH